MIFVSFLLFNFGKSFNNCNNNLVYYWGQNSYGAAHNNEENKWEKDLIEYCDEGSADIYILSFLNVFNAGKGLPEINFANHCDRFFNETEAKKLRYCPKIGLDSKKCQSKNKIILLSLGGAVGNVGFQSSYDAKIFAKTIWDMFLGGTHKYRPLGDAILDGVDLDIEGGPREYYDVFVDTLREYYVTDKSKKYYVGAAPQCEFPDRHLGAVLNSSYIDFIFIQFYNNWCGVQNFNNRFAWNYPTWDQWATTKSPNKNVKLFLGVPSSKSAAGSGYIDHTNLQSIVKNLISYSTFSGMMMWDASQAHNNVINGKNYGNLFKNYLNSITKCSTD